MSKVRCSICGNEKNGLCLIKKGKVKLNKPRHCEAFMYEEAKLKAKQDIPYIRFRYAEMKEQKKLFKEELKLLKEQMQQNEQAEINDTNFVAQNQKRADKFIAPSGNQKHPLTGDLSRFLTTAQKGRSSS